MQNIRKEFTFTKMSHLGFSTAFILDCSAYFSKILLPPLHNMKNHLFLKSRSINIIHTILRCFRKKNDLDINFFKKEDFMKSGLTEKARLLCILQEKCPHCVYRNIPLLSFITPLDR